jgi:hypothetical protein
MIQRLVGLGAVAALLLLVLTRGSALAIYHVEITIQDGREHRPEDPDPSLEASLLSVSSVSRVHLVHEAWFWRRGIQVPSFDLLVIRGRVRNLAEFVPMNRADPSFVLGDAVCVVVRGPFPAGEFVVVAPEAAGDPYLWLTSSGVPHSLTTTGLEAIRCGGAARVELPRCHYSVTTFLDLESLLSADLEKKR